jgi:2-(1,2-epoxy-1,2-dihydrophenyl)acetyl-CoA isomerase
MPGRQTMTFTMGRNLKMPTYDTLLYEKQRHGVLITWNRPETLNAISRQMEHELSDALREAERDPEIRAIVMTGMVRAFSSGY